jgi:hypothetical protein
LLKESSMVCFDIVIGYPVSSRRESNSTFDTRIEHLRKHYRADSLGEAYEEGLKLIRFAICDEDAIAFLRDVPSPTFCLSIALLRKDTLLYTNYKATGQYTKPPQHPLLKQVYWTASKLEKWQPLKKIADFKQAVQHL